MSQYTIPCGRELEPYVPELSWKCGHANRLCLACHVMRALREALMAHLEYETLHPIPLIKPTVEEAERYMEMIDKSTKALSRVQEWKSKQHDD